MVARGQGANVPKPPSGSTPQQGANTPTVKFIGAVDDQWQMFRSVYAHISLLNRLLGLEHHFVSSFSPLLCSCCHYHHERSTSSEGSKERKSDKQSHLSDDPNDYELGAPIGFGATSVVHAAIYRPSTSSPDVSNANTLATPLPCAIKVVNLDKLPPQALRLLRRETQLMSLSKHPNLLRVRGSWVAGHNLYIALRLMNAGSAADIMRYAWPSGMEEEVVKCILKQALQGLKCVLVIHSASAVNINILLSATFISTASYIVM